MDSFTQLPPRVPLRTVLKHFRRFRRARLVTKQWLALLVLAEDPERALSWQEIEISLGLTGKGGNTAHQKKLAGQLIQAGVVCAKLRPNKGGARPSTVYQITGKGRVFLGLDQEGNFR